MIESVDRSGVVALSGWPVVRVAGRALKRECPGCGRVVPVDGGGLLSYHCSNWEEAYLTPRELEPCVMSGRVVGR